MEKLSLNVPDISCPICAGKVKDRIDVLDGVSNSSTDMKSQTLEVEYDPEKLKPQEIIDEVASLGYKISN
ncbi:MAG: heavy-metal-associated domain-containing protein [Eubacteriales bacterium]|nr:heavy-metal-associated domain-containing protein [Eubacteriales bacterium]